VKNKKKKEHGDSDDRAWVYICVIIDILFFMYLWVYGL